MKEVALITVSLFIGVVIGYLYRDYHSKEYEETKGLFTEDKKQNQHVTRYMYYTGEEDWEDLIFQEYDDFGQV